MNLQHLHAIFQKYIDQFEYINNKRHVEYYKWVVAEQFRQFDFSAPDLAERLASLKKAAGNLFDSSHQLPFAALVMYAQEEPEVVRKMFLDLYAEDHGDLEIKQQKLRAFTAQSEELKNKYAPGSFLYANNLRSAMQFLFLRDPDHNYMYKANQAKAFADCVDFFDDWGSMSDFKLPVYYRMCDALVEEIKRYPALVETHLSRYEKYEEPMHPDKELHILAFDIIYTSQVYGFYYGMDIRPITAQARRLREERIKEAQKRQEEYLRAQEDYDRLQKAEALLRSTFPAGTLVRVKGMGEGTVQADGNQELRLRFPTSDKTFDLLFFLSKKRVVFEDDTVRAEIESSLDVLERSTEISQQLKRAEERFAPY